MHEARQMDAKLLDELGRLAALQRYELLDTPPESPFDRITELVKSVMAMPIATISLIDRDRQWLKSCIGLDSTETPREIAFCTHTIKSRQPMYVPDATFDPRFRDNPLVTGPPFLKSYVGVPLSTPDGYNLGSLCVMDRKPRRFSEAQIANLQSFGSLVMDVIELRRLAQVDFATGAATRRAFFAEMEKAISRFSRHDRTSAVLVFAIDNFKQVGSAAGNEMVRGATERISAVLRGSDVLGRLGDEEFGILLTDANLEQALRAADRIGSALHEWAVSLDPPIGLAASFGVAEVGPDLLLADRWLAQAQGRLAEAKRADGADVAPTG